MISSEPIERPAWEPFTPRGVAAFAHATYGRLLLAQFIVAFLTAAAMVHFLEHAWFPVVREAVSQLPDKGELSHGELNWAGDPSIQLSENLFLGLAVDLYHSGKIGRAAHVQVEFGKSDFRIYHLLGYQVFEYPPEWDFEFNRNKLEPWWGAWQPWIAAIVAGCTVVGLLLTWSALAVLYCVPVRIISFLENRDLNWMQSWQLAAAAMLPAALFLTFGIVAYSMNMMDLIRLGGMLGLHFVIGWIYLFVSPMFCPRATTAKKIGKNPFAEPGIDDKNPFSTVKKNKNPFAEPEPNDPPKNG
jgi:hypothetical protein